LTQVSIFLTNLHSTK